MFQLLINENIKKKFIVLTLCFTIIFTSINYKKSYADGGIISLPILATVATVALATGIVLKDNNDLYDIGYMFYTYVNSNNSLMWDTVVNTFNSTVAFNQTLGKVVVGDEFGSILKAFFDDITFNHDSLSSEIVSTGSLVGGFELPYSSSELKSLSAKDNFKVGSFGFEVVSINQTITTGHKGLVLGAPTFLNVYPFTERTTSVYYERDNWTSVSFRLAPCTTYNHPKTDHYKFIKIYNGTSLNPSNSFCFTNSSVTIPYGGSYNPGNIWGDNTAGDIGIYVPGNLGNLLNGNPGDVTGDHAPPWAGDGNVSIPGVDNPSIGVGDGSFPNVGGGVGELCPECGLEGTHNPGCSLDKPVNPPVDGIWENIKAFIISLVVPSDMFWVDTWNGLHDNFVSSFPMVDMGNFEDLIVNGKPFPNIDVNIMGSKGRIVNGDTINSIVDWLRPIVAGFMMLCLMFFNYRKIYKLIRNSDPIPGIAVGTSDFRTGIDEYAEQRQIIRDTMNSMINSRKGL